MCLCDFGYKTCIPTISNLARSCGVNLNEACPTQINAGNSNGGCEGTTTTATCAARGNDGDTTWTAFLTADAHMDPTSGRGDIDSWWRVDFSRSMTVTDVKLFPRAVASWGYCGPGGAWTYPCVSGYEATGPNMKITVGDTDSFNSPNNALCYTTPLTANGIRTVTCTQPVTGRYLFIYQRGENTAASDPTYNQGRLSFADIQPIGRFADTSMACLGCTAGKYKDVFGNGACTNCVANTYSTFTAAKNASVCTACYHNAFAPAGSTSILDCGCGSGFEFY